MVESLTPYPTMAPNADNTSGPTYTFSPTMVGGEIGGDGLNPDSVTVDKSESTNNSQTIIAAGATAGVCVAILTLAIGMFFVRKKRRENFQQSKTSTQDMTPDRVGLEIETQSETLYQQNQPQSYFGTIHKKEGEVDDISTLGDPYMGDAVNARMDADNTVGERYVLIIICIYMDRAGSAFMETIPYLTHLFLSILSAWYQISNNSTSTELANQVPMSVRQVEWENPPYSLVAKS